MITCRNVPTSVSTIGSLYVKGISTFHLPWTALKEKWFPHSQTSVTKQIRSNWAALENFPGLTWETPSAACLSTDLNSEKFPRALGQYIIFIISLHASSIVPLIMPTISETSAHPHLGLWRERRQD